MPQQSQNTNAKTQSAPMRCQKQRCVNSVEESGAICRHCLRKQKKKAVTLIHTRKEKGLDKNLADPDNKEIHNLKSKNEKTCRIRSNCGR
eukprot:m.253179 g.253179  ORF g.253179 m.253179 type:complete len:90 (+) comp15928_c0_seq4:747-1016(+)